MTNDDQDPSEDDARALDDEQAVVSSKGEAAIAETRVMNSEEAAAAETVLVEEDSASEDVAAASDQESTVLADPEAATVVVGAAVADAALQATRVLDGAQSAGAVDATKAMAGPAETRVLPERDKTMPPPVHEPMRQPPVAPPPVAAAPPSPTPIDNERGLPPGMVLFGEYEIVNVLGVGGMGEVYRAKHRRLEEHRAIKVMHAELATKKGASEFFYREAKALLAVRHPAVVHCHDLLSDDKGRVYLIMEMIEGIPLSKKMNDGPLSTDEVAILGARVAHGLTAAHRKGVIHRDLSPDNIVLPNGRVQEAKIIDFGIAKLLQDGEGTIIDGFKGKLSYASPEQLGFFGGKIDGRSDFYSLGLVLVAAALGRPMSMGTSVVEAVDARRAFKTLPDGIPIGLRSALMPLLSLDPKDRPEHVDRLFVGPGTADASVGEDSGPPATSPSHSRAPSAEAPNRTALYAGITGAAALLLGGGGFFAMSGEETAPVPPSAETQAVETVALVPIPVAAVAPPQAPIEEVKPVVAPPPKAPTRRRLTGTDRMKIAGLLARARTALAENRLMSPADDNAYDRYRKVLKLDPTDARARDGLRQIASRYVGMAESALDRGDADQARTFVDRAERSDPTHSGIPTVQARLATP